MPKALWLVGRGPRVKPEQCGSRAHPEPAAKSKNHYILVLGRGFGTNNKVELCPRYLRVPNKTKGDILHASPQCILENFAIEGSIFSQRSPLWRHGQFLPKTHSSLLYSSRLYSWALGSPPENCFSQLPLQLRGVKSSQWDNSRSNGDDLWVRFVGGVWVQWQELEQLLWTMR